MTRVRTEARRAGRDSPLYYKGGRWNAKNALVVVSPAYGFPGKIAALSFCEVSWCRFSTLVLLKLLSTVSPAIVRARFATFTRLPMTRLLMVATDRISAFDYVLGTPIPDKGKVLTQLSAFWFGRRATSSRTPALDRRDDFPQTPLIRRCAARPSMLVRKTPVPIECVARGYLAGSGWKEYQRTARSAAWHCPPGCANRTDCRSPSSRQPRRPRVGTTSTSRKPRLARSSGDLVARLRKLTLAIY